MDDNITAHPAEDRGMVYDLVLALACVALMLVPSVVEELQQRRAQHGPFFRNDRGSMSS